ncbi:MAG: hypothetical protein ACRD12_12615, partial [Acidimicrobiales bacterium]
SVRGLAFNYFVNVGLFGGPATRLGYGQVPPGSAQAPANANTDSPSVECPSGGGDPAPATDAQGARAAYGPAIIFGGIWPDANNVAPPSGPLSSDVNCQLGAAGFVTASTDIAKNPDGTTWTLSGGGTEGWPGGVGPDPFHADTVHSECRADESGNTGSVRITNGQVVTSTDRGTQLPATTVDIPANVPANSKYHGTIDHVGDNFDITLNEQITNSDGSITVIAAHMKLNGPIAVGEMVIGSVTCGLTETSGGGGGGSGGSGGGTGGTGGTGGGRLSVTGISANALPAVLFLAFGLVLVLLAQPYRARMSRSAKPADGIAIGPPDEGWSPGDEGTDAGLGLGAVPKPRRE